MTRYCTSREDWLLWMKCKLRFPDVPAKECEVLHYLIVRQQFLIGESHDYE